MYTGSIIKTVQYIQMAIELTIIARINIYWEQYWSKAVSKDLRQLSRTILVWIGLITGLPGLAELIY